MLIFLYLSCSSAIGFNEDYEDIVYGLQEAIEHRKSGGICQEQYVCKPMEWI